jgi:hypothetical protein
VLRQPCEVANGVGDRHRQADLAQRGGVVAGQDRHGQQLRAGARARLRGARDHRPAAQRVDVDEAGAERRRCGHRVLDRVRDVVVLEVEEHPVAGGGQLAHERGAGGGEELLADLEHADPAGEPPDQRARGVRAGHVEGDDQAIPRVHVRSGISSVPTTWRMSVRPWRTR